MWRYNSPFTILGSLRAAARASEASRLRAMAAASGSPLVGAMSRNDPQCNDPHKTTLVYIGLAAAVIGQLIMSSGMILLRSAALMEADTVFWKRRLFWAGFALLLVNAIGVDGFVYAVTPLSLVSPVATLSVFFTMVLASMGCCLPAKESVTLAQWAAGGVMIAGIGVSSLFGPNCNNTDLDELNRNALAPATVAFSVVSLFALIIALLVMRFKRETSPVRTLWLVLGSALCAAFASLTLKIGPCPPMAPARPLPPRAALGARSQTDSAHGPP